jgi:hypothetical protein
MLQHYTGRNAYIVEFIPREKPALEMQNMHLIDLYETGFPDPLVKYKPGEFSKGCPPVWAAFDCKILATKHLYEWKECIALIEQIKKENSFMKENAIALEDVYNAPQGHYRCEFSPVLEPALTTSEQLEIVKSYFSK